MCRLAGRALVGFLTCRTEGPTHNMYIVFRLKKVGHCAPTWLWVNWLNVPAPQLTEFVGDLNVGVGVNKHNSDETRRYTGVCLDG